MVEMSAIKKFDVAVIGGGVVGINFAFWLSELYDCSIILIEKESGLAFHQSSRNTCGVHRPVLFDPRTNSGRMQNKSYYLWKRLATTYQLPWIQQGRLTVAFDEDDVFLIERGLKWAVENGVPEDEIALLDRDGVKRLEPYVDCVKGLHSKTESMTAYGELCRKLFQLCEDNGVILARGACVDQLREDGNEIKITLHDSASGIPFVITCSYLINAAGGMALNFAHMLGYGKEYNDLHLRGEYWIVNGPLVSGISRNIYPVTRHGIEGIDMSYMGPHFVTRYDGLGGWRKEIGPTAAPVLGAYAYNGISESALKALEKIFAGPVKPWFKVLTRKEFYSFAWNQWAMMNSKASIVRYLKHVIPSLDVGMLVSKGITGVLYEVLGEQGFTPEPVVLEGPNSISVLYMGIGATAAPSFCACTLTNLMRNGHFERFKTRGMARHDQLWSFDFATALDKNTIIPH